MRSPFLSSPCGWQTLLPILRAESQAESANRPKSGHPTALPVWKPLNCRYQNAWSSKQRGGHCLRHKIPHRQSCCGRNSLMPDMVRWKNLKCVPKGFNYLHGHQSGSCLRPLSSLQASKYNKPAPLWLWSGTVFMHHQQSWTVLCQLCFFKGSFSRDSFWGVYFWFLLLGEPHFLCRGHQILVLLLSRRKNQKTAWKLASSGDTIQQNSSPTGQDPHLRTTSSKVQPISWAMRL